MHPFFIVCLPRSRSAWLANALTSGRSACLFEGTWGCRSLDDLDRVMVETGAEAAGNSDCVNSLLFERLVRKWPQARFVVIRRDPARVATSLDRLGLTPGPEKIAAMSRGIEAAAAHANAITVDFDALTGIEAGESIWRHCAPGQRFNRRRWQMLLGLNVQVSYDAEAEKVRRHGQAMQQLLGGST
jgi:hypothetical protein